MHGRPATLLATCRVSVITHDARNEEVRMLIDQGSELSFISEDLVTKLKLTRRGASIPLIGIGGTYSGRTRGLVNVPLHSIHDSSVAFNLQAYILPRLTFNLPSFTISNDNWTHLRSLQLADPMFGQPQPVNIILGADAYGHIIKPELIKGDSSSPLAQLTIFGWILSGPVAIMKSNSIESYHCSIDHDLQDLLTKFWLQEEVSQNKSGMLTPDETKCEDHFRSTFSRDNTGRYIVKLPLISPATSLGDSSAKALRCLSKLTRHFQRDPSYQRLYTDFLQEYISLRHMIAVPDSDVNCHPTFYLPHRGVYREHSQTTKLRVVFNGSSRSDNGISLNDILHSGPKLQTDIQDVLLWFRRHQYVFSTDIVKMYRQIQVHKDDWDLQRIYWHDTNEQPRAYQLTTVTYGLNCAPFLALRVINQLIEDEGHRFPNAIPTLSKGRYIDDIFGGAESIEKLLEIIEQLKTLLLAGGFPLQKWHSNCNEVTSNSSYTTTEETTAVEVEASQIKVLGLSWHPNTDTFQFTSWPSTNRKITKRTVLSEIAQLYDPLGMISPVVVRAKMFIQELWLAKINWDEPLSEVLQNRWNKFREQLPHVSNLRIPRCLYLSSSSVSVEIHGFCDASQLAMAAVLYARVMTSTNEIYVNIICSKTKIAPLKRMTIPRLELTAALLLARLIAKTQSTLNLSSCPTFLWTDSSITLTWISSHPSKWKDFVRNRTTAIQEAVPDAFWGFVPGKENPADCASRGVDANAIDDHPLWWKGPAWLIQSRDTWPKFKPTCAQDADVEERARRVLTTTHDSSPSCWDLIERYSTFTKLIRITALCQRAAARFRGKAFEPLDHPLTPANLQHSRHFWIRQLQNYYFDKEITMLNRREELTRSNPLIRLTPFVDKYGLLRVGGRLQHANVDPDFKHPFILPRHSPLTTLIIADAHLQTLHGGTQVTLSYTRQTYWIIGGRAPVRSYILRCVRCARHRKLRAQQLMGQLPSNRITPSRPFLHTGVDYAGPFSIKTWRGRAAKTYKGYLAIFVCFSTSAIHIEIVTDYTTDAFIAAYKRFTSRRGICATLNSDCGTNFIGANAELRRLFNASYKESRDLAIRLATSGTEWRFIPPASPHFGGKWEAAVKSTKYHLRRVLGDSILTYEELSTLTTQIEAILNSRPLCPLSEDGDDYSVLTPGHFLVGEALTTIPEPNLIDEPISRLSRWQLIRQKVEIFWKRWKSECLQRYQAISKWHHPKTEIKEGSLVLMVDERCPPTKWPLARVEKLHPGSDGLTRVVTLRTSTTTFKRPIQKVCVLFSDPDVGRFGNSVPEGGRENVQ